MKSKLDVEQKLELIKFALLYGNVQKKSEIKMLQAQLKVLEWVLKDDNDDE